VYKLIESVHRGRVQILRQVAHRLFQIFVSFVEEILLGARLPVIACRDQQRVVVFEVAKRVKDFQKLENAHIFFLLLSSFVEYSVLVAE